MKAVNRRAALTRFSARVWWDCVNRGHDPERFDYLADGLPRDKEPPSIDHKKRFFGDVETLAKVASMTAPTSNWLAKAPPAEAVMERIFSVDRRRSLPAFCRQTPGLVRRPRRLLGRSRDGTTGAVLYPDLYTNYANVECGKAAVPFGWQNVISAPRSVKHHLQRLSLPHPMYKVKAALLVLYSQD